MIDRENFLKEIRRCPDDDFPRLVYADWLEEQGDSLCELIRLQCEISPKEPKDIPLVKHRREKELIEEHAAEWIQPLLQLEVLTPQLTRGFVELIRMETHDFIHSASEVFEAAPVAWKFKLKNAAERGQMAQLQNHPGLSRIQSLNLRFSRLPRRQLIGLLSSEHLTSLQWLDLGMNNMTATDVVALKTPGVRKLRSLDFSGNRLGDPGMRALLGVSQLASLEELYLRDNDLSARAVTDLVSSLLLERLRVLDLYANPITVLGMQSLAHSPAVANLETLGLRHCEGVREGLAEFCASPHWQELTTLDLREIKLRAADVSHLVNGNFPKLETLKIHARYVHHKSHDKLKKRFGNGLELH